MGLLWFIGLVLLVTILIGGYIAFLKGANSDKQPTPQCSCKLCDDTPEVTTQPKVYTTDCGACVWRHPSNCKECPITINRQNLKRAQDDGVVYPDGEDEIEERRRLR